MFQVELYLRLRVKRYAASSFSDWSIPSWGISFDIMCSWRMCHMVELSYKIGTLDYWDVGEKHQMHTLRGKK